MNIHEQKKEKIKSNYLKYKLSNKSENKKIFIQIEIIYIKL
jgi:hypothetical protein